MRASHLVRLSRSRWARVLFSAGGIPLAIALVTLIVFSPALWNGFVEWDDSVNLGNNPDYRGLGWRQLRWMFTSVLMGHWIPLTWMTLGLDYVLWGMNPVGYHLSNLLLHAANAAVFYFVALRLLGLVTPGPRASTLRLGAAAAALFFAVHPLRAESVAWVTERRDVLSGLFFLLTILTYLKAREGEGTGRRRWLAGSVGLYALAVSSKAAVMALPLVLILLDIYPLRRLAGWRQWTAPKARRVWAEKIPYLLLAFAGAGMALYAVWANSFLTPFERYPLLARVGMAFYSLWFYVWKSLLPLGLSPLYELPARVNPLDPPFLLSAVAVGILTGGFWLLRRRWPAGLAVWVSYVVILAPVSGIPFHSGHQLTNDRYSYLSCLGWALLVGAGVCAVLRARASGMLRPSVARLASGAAAVWLIGLAVLTWQQVQVWRDTDTLWRYAIEFNSACSICNGNLGLFLMNKGYATPAIPYLQQAVALRPERTGVYGALGLAFLQLGRLDEAVEYLQRGLERVPRDVGTRTNLAAALIQQGKPGEAIEHLQQILRLNPDHAQVHANLGVALTELGRPAEAIEHYRRAIELKPEAPLARYGLARAYLAMGKTGAAQQEYAVLEKLDPRLASQLSPLVKR